MLISILILLVILTSAITLSLIQSKRNVVLFLLSILAIMMVLTPQLLKLNFGVLKTSMENMDTLRTITLLILVESIIAISLGLSGIRKHYGLDEKSKFWWLLYLPRPSLILALVIISIHVLYRFSGMNYLLLMAISSLIFVIGLLLISILFRFVFRKWEQRLELKMILVIFQAFSSSFVPTLLSRVNFLGSPPEISLFGLKLLMILLALIVGLSFIGKILIYNYREKHGLY